MPHGSPYPSFCRHFTSSQEPGFQESGTSRFKCRDSNFKESKSSQCPDKIPGSRGLLCSATHFKPTPAMHPSIPSLCPCEVYISIIRHSSYKPGRLIDWHQVLTKNSITPSPVSPHHHLPYLSPPSSPPPPPFSPSTSYKTDSQP